MLNNLRRLPQPAVKKLLTALESDSFSGELRLALGGL